MKWPTWYTNLFYQHIMFRHSCGNCHFCNTKRPSDITLADYWGWQKDDPTFNADDKGANLVLINTEKGREVFEAVRDRLNVINATPGAFMQPNLQHPSIIHKKRLKFERDYVEKGFEYIYKHDYDKNPFVIRACKKLKRMIKKIIWKK